MNWNQLARVKAEPENRICLMIHNSCGGIIRSFQSDLSNGFSEGLNCRLGTWVYVEDIFNQKNRTAMV
ncbi:hypothetical protein [Neobacillus soli]|uniref:hypothetical protein n=1 Tax=Neobacillus soli TaxID=220688 RepID=UPI000825B07E|nr:hypothetical protein [Neobacillus soli]